MPSDKGGVTVEFLVVGTVAAVASALTFFSGFGLGTILTPVFALFFPVPVAVGVTAIVHLANNLFKLALMGRQADWQVVARFAVPAAAAAFVGAFALRAFEGLPVVATYSVAEATFEVSPVKAVIGILIAAFALLELSSWFQSLALPARWLPLGGMLSGFFGGLSGNQGAFRSVFLLKAGLSKEGFVATGVVSAIIIDVARLAVYGTTVFSAHFSHSRSLIAPVVVASLCAFTGAAVGKRLLRNVTLRAVQVLVAAGMLAIGLGLAAGML